MITGGAGFIGSHLSEFYLENGDEVHAIDYLSTGSLANIAHLQDNPRFSFIKGDILTYPQLADEVQWADYVYHLAAVVGVCRVLENPLRGLTVNIHGCERLLALAAETKSSAKILIASSSSVYGSLVPAPQSEKDNLIIDARMDKLWSYALSKITNENFALSHYRMHKMPVIIARLFNCVGPRQTGQYGMVVPRFVKCALSGSDIEVFGDGNQTRSFCDVRDTVAIFDRLMKSDKCWGEIINVGNDREISINDLAALIIKETNSQSAIKHIPYEKAYNQDFTDIKNRKPDLTKMHRLIDFKHQWTLEDTIQAIREQVHA